MGRLAVALLLACSSWSCSDKSDVVDGSSGGTSGGDVSGGGAASPGSPSIGSGGNVGSSGGFGAGSGGVEEWSGRSGADSGGNVGLSGSLTADSGGNVGSAGSPNAGSPGASAGRAGAPGDECTGVSLLTSGVLDLDLHAIQLSGRVTLNGVPFPDEPRGRGTLVFEDHQGRGASVDLGSTGPVEYALTLPPGVYDVRLEGNAALADTMTAPIVPSGSGVVLSNVRIAARGVLDVDIRAVRITGRTTLNGAQLPDEIVDRGTVSLIADDGNSGVTAPYGASGPATHALMVLPGEYRVLFGGNPELCGATPTPSVPCNSGVVVESVRIQSDGVLDVDVPAITVRGNVTLDGHALPDEAEARGTLSFVGSEGVAKSSDLGTTGGANYELRLLPGTYQVVFNGNSDLCGGADLPLVPCNAGTVMSNVALTTDGVLDVDLRTATVRGNVTLNGAPMPTESTSRGSLAFVAASGSRFQTAPFEASDPVRYAARLLQGEYDVHFVANPALCGTSQSPLVPCIGGPVLRAISISADGVLDVDLRGVSVGGRVTLNGAAFPDLDERGQLSFSLLGGENQVTVPIRSNDPASYAVRLLSGSYAVGFVGDAAWCASGAAELPCNSGPLHSNLDFQSDGVLDLDVPRVDVTGNVTLNGSPLPDESSHRGRLAFTWGDTEPQPACDLGETGHPAYGMSLLPGSYVIEHLANADLCATEAVALIPCASQTLAGCD